jgi:hypothetical protein
VIVLPLKAPPLKALRDGTLPGKLTHVADAELMKR